MKTKEDILKEFDKEYYGGNPYAVTNTVRDFLSKALDRVADEARQEALEEAGYKIISVLTNGNYINGVDAVDISNEVVDQLKAGGSK